MRKSVLVLAVALATVAMVLIVALFFTTTKLTSGEGIEPLAGGPFMSGVAPPSTLWQSYDASAPVKPPPQHAAATASSQAAAESRLVVKEGFVRLIVSDVEEAASRVLGEVERLGGYLVKDEGGIGQRTLTVRVPSDKLDEFMAFFGQGGCARVLLRLGDRRYGGVCGLERQA